MLSETKAGRTASRSIEVMAEDLTNKPRRTVVRPQSGFIPGTNNFTSQPEESPVEAVVGVAQREPDNESVFTEAEDTPETFIPEPAVPFRAPSSMGEHRSRVSMMPFAVLLPPLGELRALRVFRARLEGRLDEIGGVVESAAQARAMRDEARMIEQALAWLDAVAGREAEARLGADSLDDAELRAIYELGRLYFETGFLPEAEIIFLGLRASSSEFAACFLGLGVVRLEKGEFQQALLAFREAVKQPRFMVEAKIGMAATYLALGEARRAGTLLSELSQAVNGEIRQLWHALSLRCA